MQKSINTVERSVNIIIINNSNIFVRMDIHEFTDKLLELIDVIIKSPIVDRKGIDDLIKQSKMNVSDPKVADIRGILVIGDFVIKSLILHARNTAGMEMANRVTKVKCLLIFSILFKTSFKNIKNIEGSLSM